MIDSDISYSKYSPESVSDRSYVIEYFPGWISKTLKIIYYSLLAVMLLAVAVALLSKENEIPGKIALIIVFLVMVTPLLWIIQI